MKDFHSKRADIAVAAALMLAVIVSSVAAESPGVHVFDFERDQVGRLPSGFSAALTGQGRPGKWMIVAAPDAPSGRHVLAQTDADRTSYFR